MEPGTITETVNLPGTTAVDCFPIVISFNNEVASHLNDRTKRGGCILGPSMHNWNPPPTILISQVNALINCTSPNTSPPFPFNRRLLFWAKKGSELWWRFLPAGTGGSDWQIPLCWGSHCGCALMDSCRFSRIWQHLFQMAMRNYKRQMLCHYSQN